MDENKTAKEAIWGEIQPLMAKQLTGGSLSSGERERLDHLVAALNALGPPEPDSQSGGALLDAFRQLSLLRLEHEASRSELQRIVRLLERRSRRRQRIGVGLGAAVGLTGLWLGLSLLLLLIFRWLDAFTVRMLCAGSMAGLGLAIFVFQKRLLEQSRTDWPDSEDEEDGL